MQLNKNCKNIHENKLRADVKHHNTKEKENND